MKKKETNPADLTNPNNDAYWQRLGYDKRPKNWKKLLKNRPKSKRAKKRDDYIPPDGGITWPLCKDDY